MASKRCIIESFSPLRGDSNSTSVVSDQATHTIIPVCVCVRKPNSAAVFSYIHTYKSVCGYECFALHVMRSETWTLASVCCDVLHFLSACVYLGLHVSVCTDSMLTDL